MAFNAKLSTPGRDDSKPVDLKIYRAENEVRIEFGIQVTWIGFSIEGTVEFIKLLMKHAGIKKIEFSDE